MKGTRSALTVASVLAFLSFACVDATGPAGPGNQANGRVSIVNDAGTLGTQVTYFNDSIPVDATGVGYPSAPAPGMSASLVSLAGSGGSLNRSEEHTSELQSRLHLVCRLLLEKKKKTHATSQ